MNESEYEVFGGMIDTGKSKFSAKYFFQCHFYATKG